MNTSSSSSAGSKQFLLLFRHTDWDKNMPLEEAGSLMNRINEWFEKLAGEGLVLGGHPLHSSGVSVSGKGGATVTDGPFTESKEVIGGYVILAAPDLDTAVQIAKSNPILDYGMTVEVREVAEECPVFKRVMQRLQLASAT